MAKNEQAATVEVVEAAVPITVSLNEFCSRLSETVVRPELIGAFASTERAQGNLRSTAEDYAARYNSFINKPV